MYILTTDVLSCPRCGPDFGLILFSERTESRRVLQGAVACANCRERYAIRGGFADLRVAGGAGGAGGGPGAERPELSASAGGGGGDEGARAFRLLALLGIAEGPALALVAGDAALLATRMAQAIEHLEVIAAHEALEHEAEHAGVTRIAVGGRLPFYSGSLRGVVLSGGAAAALLEEGSRVLAPAARLVLESAPTEARGRVERTGLHVLAEEAGTLVAVRR